MWMSGLVLRSRAQDSRGYCAGKASPIAQDVAPAASGPVSHRRTGMILTSDDRDRSPAETDNLDWNQTVGSLAPAELPSIIHAPTPDSTIGKDHTRMIVSNASRYRVRDPGHCRRIQPIDGGAIAELAGGV